jgi:DNA invertase Pin-like site-specific DNA recombinase
MYDEVADTYGCSRSAVSRRWRGVSRPRADGVADSLALPPPQERELIEYITKLYFQGLAPTREIVRNFDTEIARRELLKR